MQALPSSSSATEPMTSQNRKTLILAAGFGAVAGLRSMIAPALLSRHLARWSGRTSAATRLLSAGPVPTLLTLAAAGEMVADKTPFIPNRTDPAPMAGRMLIGAFVGAAVAGRRGGSTVPAAFVGATAALCTTLLGYRLRRAASTSTDLPDLAVALAEDAVAVSAAAALTRAVG